MQQNGQEQPQRDDLHQAAEQPEQGGEAHPGAESPQLEQDKLGECQDQLKRAQADFINYRRRMSQELAEGRIAAQSALLAQLLPVLDDLGRAQATAPPELTSNSWVQGLMLIARRFTTLLDQLGVRQIGAPGERFDPRWHEAITTETRADVPEGTILQVARPGYAIGERVIRPAQVVVARAPSPIGEAQGQQGDARA